MTSITVGLDDKLAARLAERAARAGVSPEELAGKTLEEFLSRSDASFDFSGTMSSDQVSGDRVDDLLAEGFPR